MLIFFQNEAPFMLSPCLTHEPRFYTLRGIHTVRLQPSTTAATALFYFTIGEETHAQSRQIWTKFDDVCRKFCLLANSMRPTKFDADLNPSSVSPKIIWRKTHRILLHWIWPIINCPKCHVHKQHTFANVCKCGRHKCMFVIKRSVLVP